MAGVDAAQHRGGLVIAQGAFENFFHVVRSAQAQIGLALDLGHKFVQHGVDRFLREFRHLHHGHTQTLHFFGVQVANDVGRLLFAQQQHKHGGALCTGQGVHFPTQGVGVACGAVGFGIVVCHGIARYG